MAKPGRGVSYERAIDVQKAWDSSQSVKEAAEKLGIGDERTVMRMRRGAEEVLGITLPSFRDKQKQTNFPEFLNYNHERKSDYTIVIGSDRHNLPGDVPQAFWCFLHLIEDIKPSVVHINGDWFDFSGIGRFHRIGWQEQPGIAEELHYGKEALERIENKAPKAKKVFTLGNHDMRFDGKLANCLPELEDIHGTKLADHMPKWELCVSAVYNDTMIVKHRWHGGIHSSFNDVRSGGKSIATGHDHKLNIRPYTDYSGLRFGIKTGTLSNLWDPTFEYTENNACDWQPGFAVVHVHGNVVIPEACPMVIDKSHPKWGKVHYHGKWYG